MKKGFTVILLTVFLLYRITFPTSVVHAEEVEISAPSGILMEMSTGTVLFEKDADTARPPASVTKIMTMLLIFDALENGTISLDDEVLFTCSLSFFHTLNNMLLNIIFDFRNKN